MVTSPTYLAIRAYTRLRIARGRLLREGRRWSGVRILGYHRLADERHPLSVRPERFRAQMEELRGAGVQIVSLERAVELLESPIEGRYVCVTFDDGYRDNLEHGVPVLEKLEIPATIFVPTAVIDGDAGYWWFQEQPPALSWEEIRGLLAGGLIDVQPHTRTHPLLPQIDDAAAYDEIIGSRDDLFERSGRGSTTFCYPAGLYGPREEALVREAGYRAAVTTAPGVNPGGRPMETLHRTLVYYPDTDADFRAKLAGILDRPPILRRAFYRRRGGR